MIKHFREIAIFVLVIVSMQLFEAQFLPEGITAYLQFFGVAAAVTVSVPFMLAKRKGFVLPVQLMFAAVIISAVMAKFFWNQGIADTVKATVPYLIWAFFFYLVKTKVQVQSIEKIVLIYGFIFIAVYFFQLANADHVMFGGKQEFETERGIPRIFIPGSGIFVLASFISLNKFTEAKKGKWKWLPLILLGLLFPFLIATRQLIVTILFIFTYHFTKKIDFVKKGVVLGTFVALVLILFSLQHPIVEGLKKTQEQTIETGTKNIRILAATYFLTDFSPSPINKVLGNGVAYGEKSDYGKFVTGLGNKQGYYLTDVGLIGLYTMFGILPLFAYFLIWVRGYKINVPKEYYYVKYYLWYLLLTSLTSSTVFNVNYLITTVFVLYIFHTIHVHNKNQDLYLKVVRKIAKEEQASEELNPVSE